MSRPMTFEVHVDVEAIDRADEMHGLLTQADAVLSLVTHACGELKQGISVDQETLANAVWAAQTLIGQALTLSAACTKFTMMVDVRRVPG